MMTPIGEKSTRVTPVTKNILNYLKTDLKAYRSHGYCKHSIMSGKKEKKYK